MPSKQGEEYVEKAINDALNILKTCEPCRLMFDNEDANYAIELLKSLRRDKVIIISTAVPKDFSLSRNLKKLTVSAPNKFNGSAAEVLDLAGTSSGQMKMPCVYINPEGFIVTGRPAENFALYGLEPPVQRAVAILHELGHVAGILQYDGEGAEEPDNGAKSTENTNCVRWNCISCKTFQTCPNTPPTQKHRRRNRFGARLRLSKECQSCLNPCPLGASRPMTHPM